MNIPILGPPLGTMVIEALYSPNRSIAQQTCARGEERLDTINLYQQERGNIKEDKEVRPLVIISASLKKYLVMCAQGAILIWKVFCSPKKAVFMVTVR